MTRSVHIEVGGESLQLLPERAVFRPRDHAVFVADVHVGKAASFRAHGVAVPAGTTGGTLERLDALLGRTDARRLVILGDFLHSRAGRQPHTEQRVAQWRATHPHLQIELIRGNHDRQAGDPDQVLNILLRDAPAVDGGLVLLHHPPGDRHRGWLAGHVHPGIGLTGAARQRHFLPCFHHTEHGLILPAFGEFTGLGAIIPRSGDRVFAVAEDEVIEVGRRFMGDG